MIKPTLKFARVLVKSGPLVNTGNATWASLPGKPIEFKPEPHNHTLANITGLPELSANVTTIQGEISTLIAIDQTRQAEVAKLTADVNALKTATPSSHNHLTAQVTGLDSWMSTTDSDITGIRSVLASKSSIGHTHLAADITDLPTQLATKADRVHVHGIDDVTGLRAALANVTAGNHTHAINDVTGLQACLTGLAGDLTTVTRDLASKADNTRYATTARAGLVKVGRNLTVAADGTLDAVMTTVAWGNITGTPTSFTPTAHAHAIADVTDLQACLTKAATDIASLTACIPTLALKVHNHPISDVTGLNAALGQITACFTRVDNALNDKIDEALADLKYAGIAHTHYIDDVNGLRTELDSLTKAAGRTNYALPPATVHRLGGIIVGKNLSIALDGTLDATGGYVLPEATAGRLGGIIVGQGLTIDRGTLAVDPLRFVSVFEKGSVNGVASLDAAGKVPASQISAVAISDTFVVANQTERLAVPASIGDVAVQLDVQQTFILQKPGATDNNNWVQLLNNVACVTSVNGQTGNVELFGKDIKNNVWGVNGFTGNVTLRGTDLANNVASFHGRYGDVTIRASDLPLAVLGSVGAVRPDGNTTFTDSNGTMSAIVSYTKAEIDAKVDAMMTGISHGVAVVDITGVPPAVPVVYNPYIVGEPASGAFLGHENELAEWDGAAWKFIAPRNGESHMVESQVATFHWNGKAWVKIASASTAAVSAGDIWVVGDIKHSTLTEQQFKVAIGLAEESKWALADGRDVSTSAWARVTGQNNLPDLRGAFLRMAGQNHNSQWVGGTLNGYQEDTTRLPRTAFAISISDSGLHRHATGAAAWGENASNWYGLKTESVSKRIANYDGNTYSTPWTTYDGTHSHTATITGGDTETRPKSFSVNYFIKIN